jgi:hypothetical protein
MHQGTKISPGATLRIPSDPCPILLRLLGWESVRIWNEADAFDDASQPWS